MKLAFYQGRSFVSRLIRFVTWGKYSHVAVILDDGRILEAWHKPSGVRWISHLGDGHQVGTLVDVFDVPELPFPHSATAAAADMIGMKYDFAGLLGFVVRRRTQDSNRLFCSEAAVMLAAIGGVELIRAPAWKVSPSLLATSAVLKLYGHAITGKRATLIRRVNVPTQTRRVDANAETKRISTADVADERGLEPMIPVEEVAFTQTKTNIVDDAVRLERLCAASRCVREAEAFTSLGEIESKLRNAATDVAEGKHA